MESTVVNDIIQRLEEKYGKVSLLDTTWVNIHDYLGVVLYFSMKGKVRLMMTKHVHSILETNPTDMEGLLRDSSGQPLVQYPRGCQGYVNETTGYLSNASGKYHICDLLIVTQS